MSEPAPYDLVAALRDLAERGHSLLDIIDAANELLSEETKALDAAHRELYRPGPPKRSTTTD